ncbi:exocyst complex component 8 isoform X2 [Folsomia candida]|uniref:exocyst complex component 8 isoform X2 n=1 Tax=Folsomia candida TaxID=158441 RepID=UPI000B8F381E|nr:exocyst complex component 8 isoform X2 [Folsomia candida]
MSLADIFASKDFDPEKYVSEIGSKCVGGTELAAQKAKLQNLSDETHVVLKKNVFQHYGQFIDTAKDISYLAGEMCQISQMLRDQKNLIQSLVDFSVLGKKPSTMVETPTDVESKPIHHLKGSDEAKKKLLTVLEKVEGAAEIVENEQRNLIFEGDLLEINPDNYSAVQRKRGYLFNDGVMLASWVTNRRGPQRYKFEAFYELAAIGLVVNIRDPECPKCTFKLLIFPNVHLLQCPSQPDKDSWVNEIESQQKIMRNPAKIGKSPISEYAPTGFPETETTDRAKSPEDSLVISLQPPLPDWILDLNDDLDVWIAQRNFLEAVNHYESFQEFLEEQPLSSNLKDVKSKVDARIKSLIEILVSDLQVMTPEKILQGGPRSIRKSVDLLVRLGRESQATRLFLQHRSAYIKQRLKRLKTEGRSQLYLDNMVVIFFSNIIDTMKEYTKSFSTKTSSVSGLVVWINSEVGTFLNTFCRQLFGTQAHLSAVSNSVAKLRGESKQLSDMGMDIIATVDSLLLPHVERTIVDAKDKLIEAVRHRYRSQDEIGVIMKFPDKGSLNKTIVEMGELGVIGLKDYIFAETSLRIGTNTISFAKSWLHFCQDVMQLVAPDWQTLIETAMCEVILAELRHLDKARKKINSSKTLELIDNDLNFMLGNVCRAASHTYKRQMGEELGELVAIVEEYTGEPPPSVEESSTPSKKAPVPKPRTQIPTPTKSKRYTTTAEFV